MIDLGGQPILWHIMKIYEHHGITDFVICLGYKSSLIKEYFVNFALNTSDVTIDISTGDVQIHKKPTEKWKVTLLETGLETLTGGRLKRAAPYLDDRFCMTYGDGLSDVNISKLMSFHADHGKAATVTAVFPPGRYGSLNLTPSNRISNFVEKPTGDDGYVNGGFFVLEKSVLDLIMDDNTGFEDEPLEQLASRGDLMAFRHHGFWQAMDTMRDKARLEELWNSGQAPWKTWG